MPKQSKAFLLLLLLVSAAGSLALFTRAWNERITSPFISQEESVPNTPALVVIYAPTSTAVHKEFVSNDGVTSAVLDSSTSPLPNPFFFHGTTTAFESQASWQLVQSNGKVIGSGFYSVGSPDAGIPGPFSVTGFYDVVPTVSSGTLMVYEASAKDGEPIHVVRIPVAFEQGTSTVRVFFSNASKGSDEDCEKTFGLAHTVVASADGGRGAAMHELIKGPTPYEQKKGYSTALPELLRHPAIRESGAVVTVDFDESLQIGVAGSCRVAAIRSQIEQTMAQWNPGTTVNIRINGKSEGILQP